MKFQLINFMVLLSFSHIVEKQIVFVFYYYKDNREDLCLNFTVCKKLFNFIYVIVENLYFHQIN